MPEGHTIHRLARQHNRKLKGERLAVTSPQGRFADGAAAVDGRVLERVEPVGKHLFYRFEGGRSVHVHLGLYGKFRVLKPEPTDDAGDAPPALPDPRGAVRMRLATADLAIDLNGPTACDTLDAASVAAIKNRLGPDLLDPAADAERVWRRVGRSKAPIGTLWMDQSVVSGVGNVYRTESLFRVGLDPRRPGASLTRGQFDALWRDSADLLKLGVRLGRIVTTSEADLGKPPSKATRGERFYLYKRDACRRCGGPVEKFTLAGRTVYACPREQAMA